MNTGALGDINALPADPIMARLDMHVHAAICKTVHNAKMVVLQRTLQDKVLKGCGRHAVRILDEHFSFDMYSLLAQAETFWNAPRCPSIAGAQKFLRNVRYWRTIMAVAGQLQPEYTYIEKVKRACSTWPNSSRP